MTFDQPRLMAVINVTPDSFSDGGEHMSPTAAICFAEMCLDAGADLLDIGGESTRPGAARVSPDEQIQRIQPVINGLRSAGIDAPITIDTTSSTVARAALDAGADAINDVSAGLEDPAILNLASDRHAGLILMHRVRPPDQDTYSHTYAAPLVEGDIVAAVVRFLQDRVEAAVQAGVALDAIAVDPGLGFGKTVEQNLHLMAEVGRLAVLGRPILLGASRKSFIGHVAGIDEPAERDGASVAAAVLMYRAGGRFFRVHDIAMHRRGLAVAKAMQSGLSA